MISRFVGITIIVLLLATLGVSCVGKESPPVSHGGPVTDYVSLIDSLQKEGANVEPAGEIIQEFFSTRGQAIKVNGEDVQVFEYSDQSTAEAEAALVSPDGSSIGTSLPFWVAPPHFYKAGRIIVLYVGENVAVMDVLESVIGAQFAGRSVPTSAPTPPPTSPTDTGKMVTISLTAENLAFDKGTITVPAGADVTVVFDNKDRVPHNVAFYETKAATKAIFVGEVFSGPKTISYRFAAPSTSGTYFFRCDVHPASMTGDFVVTSTGS
jgi:plastocyanin